MAHHHHHHDRHEQQQIDSDEAMAARLQAEENSRYPQQGPPSGFSAQQYQGQPQYQGYQQRPYPSYQDGPPPQQHQYQSNQQGYQQNYQQGYQQGPPPSNYQGGPPPHQYQGGLPQYGPGGPNQYHGGPPQGYQGRPPSQQPPRPQNFGGSASQGPPSGGHLRKKSLLIGINYTGSQHALRGCQQDVTNMMEFLRYKGYSSDHGSQVVMRDDRNTDPNGPFWPTGKNMLAAMHWLVSEPNTCCFLHYSGHGAQVRDPDGDRESGYDDTIVPVDFERNGQLDSDKLHKTLVSALPPSSTLFVIFDCCHSGSAIELPFVYRSDADGNVSMMDNVNAGMGLLQDASMLFQGGFTMDKLVHAKDLFSDARRLMQRFQAGDQPQEEGVGEEHFVEDWKSEHKMATMFSGCRDDQTSADANIGGVGVGAMSWAFLEYMKRNPNPTYLETLIQTRGILGQSKHKQVPQLSIGFKELDLNQPLRI